MADLGIYIESGLDPCVSLESSSLHPHKHHSVYASHDSWRLLGAFELGWTLRIEAH